MDMHETSRLQDKEDGMDNNRRIGCMLNQCSPSLLSFDSQMKDDEFACEHCKIDTC